MDNFFALIVGVGGADIPETVKDAQAICDVLITKGAYHPHNTFFLTEDKSTKDSIINAFDEIIKKSAETPDSTVFIYYSGHGQRFPKPSEKKFDYYLITYGADNNDKEKTMLNGNIFSEKIEKIKANRILVLLDCCYAGGIKTEGLKIKGEEKFLYSNRALQEKLKSGRGRVFVSSCDDNETSVILPNSKNSLFTEVALEVLNGLITPDEEYVRVIDLIHHVLITVPKKIKKYNHNQNPLLTEGTDLNHKYYVCKNGNWQPPTPPLTKTLKQLDIDPKEKTSDFDLSNFDDLSNNDKNIVNNFFKQINLEKDIETEFKVDFINEVGGLKNLKRINGKINTIKFDKTIRKTKYINTESILNTINKQIEDQLKLDFIKNYKNKI